MGKGDGQRPADDKPRFFGRRRGKTLRRTAVGLMETMLPRLAITPPGQGCPALDPVALFPRPIQAVWLEVGFGGGEHVVAQAGLHPEIGLIGCEPFNNGIASLLGHLANSEIDSVRIFPDDVRQLLPAFPQASIGRVFVLFPDPWPKKRHAERRFIGRDNLDALARVMADGAELRVASDDPVYQQWAAEQLRAHPDFTEIQVTSDRAALPADWPATRYEQKCLAGRDPVFFRFARRNRD
ncbi:tRNA (guanine(46)-N(7))-methyltransferase TrmB [Magnetospirillum sulfuroxidans]|uniref:tRNA (guanine-N(7)-)-methyltransferase n=1 Tax=Magnetospirillum sulfuroxidans TaxID=611300 RepID=A0ABS5IEV9_9PROT|nr:tRNA (guanine(46)-N(7))-methyltransferase TrmB [Magnetospirillum sulfuroxidans]MBR9972952.1 tRNA (guanosine(46)-N7)-methyltransferase TrmB [Magnetospirillum sulfuroxidans]